MRHLTLAILFISPLASALSVTNVTYTNIREGRETGWVTADIEFTIRYRNMTDSFNSWRYRFGCLPAQPISASFGGYDGGDVVSLMYMPSVPIADTTATYITLDEVFSQVLPESVTYKSTLTNSLPGALVYFRANVGRGQSSGCYSYDLGYARAPQLITQCNINVQTHLSHGTVSLPAVGNQHIANGAVQVTCNLPADVTVSTGQTGSIKINDTISTDISINGSPNSATKTVNGTELFTVSSRLHRTSASDWGGSFAQPVVMTISWP